MLALLVTSDALRLPTNSYIAGAVLSALAVTAQQNDTQAAAGSDITLSWIVQQAEGAAGLGMGVLGLGLIIIGILSLFGNVGMPNDSSRDDAYAPAAVEVEVRTARHGKRAVGVQLHS